MTTETLTPALELADYLTAIADHLRAHPNLPRVVVHTGQFNGDLQLGTGQHETANVCAWHDSLNDPVILVHPWYDGQFCDAKVAVNGTTQSGQRLEVWTRVKNLGTALGFTQDTDSVDQRVEVNVLRDFDLSGGEDAA